jgi:hypothetical protein
MKNLMALFLSITAFNAYAGNLYDHRMTVCKKGNIELTLKGKASFFGSRSISVLKSGQSILDESYDELNFPYDEHAAEMSILVPAEYNDIRTVATKAKPKSVYGDMDYTFRTSDNAIIFQTYSSLQPKFGGETSAIVLELTQTREFVIFDMDTQCQVSEI